MSSELREIMSGPITHDQIGDELTFIVDLLVEWRVNQVVVKHWFGQTTIPVSEMIQTFNQGFKHEGTFISLKGPAVFIRQVQLGDSDFTINATSDLFHSQFKISHEDEVHFYSTEEVLLSMLRNRWMSRGYAVHER